MIIAIGVTVYVAGTDAYANLKQSVDRAYAVQRLPDAIITGPGAFGLRDAAQSLPGDPIVELRQQGDVGIRVNGHPLYGRAVSIPVHHQPAVSMLALRSGDLPTRGAVAVEENLAEHYGLKPGDTVELLGPIGWQPMSVSGSAASTEYFLRPARSQREIMTTPDQFGVVFMTEADFSQVVAHRSEQLLLYSRDRDAAPALVTAATELASSRGLGVISRDQQPSYLGVRTDVRSVGTFATLLPWAFLVAAVGGAYVLLSRLVGAQRAVIGTLSANGLSVPTISAHYLAYGVSVGLAGATAGLIGGMSLGGWFTGQYTQALGLPMRVTSLHPTTLLIGAVTGIGAGVVAAWLPARAASRMSPAEAMRMSPPGTGGGISVLERFLPPLRRVPARWRMTTRGLTRNPRRALLTICGVAIAVCLVMVFAGLRDTVTRFIDRQYGGIELQDAQVITTAGAVDQVAGTLRADPRIAAVETFTRLDVTIETNHSRYDTLLIALPRSTLMHRFIAEGSVRELPTDGVLLGRGLAEILGVSVGDRVAITDSQKVLHIEQRVAGFVDEPTSPVGYIVADKVAAMASPSGVMLRLTPGARPDEVRQVVSALPGVTSYVSTDAVASTFRHAFSLNNALLGSMQLFAVMMAAALLYNTMSANVSERTNELSTLRAAGVAPAQLGRLVAAENMLLAVVSLPIGLSAGALLAQWTMSTFVTEGYRWHLDLDGTTPLVVVVAVLLVALLVQIPTFRLIARMDVAKVVREHPQ
ncbi:MAG: FtsX-like permease family protein [Mycobacteriaceae bacterium]|nr:FtsX-like permease family protein [Mycobacteriaceae bacterium]